MPELPEVETITQYLNQCLLNQSIINIHFFWNGCIQPIDTNFFLKQLIGNQIIQIKRKGKYILFIFQNHIYLLIHLRMTGQLLLNTSNSSPTTPTKHERIQFQFSKHLLSFIDQRKFGRLTLFTNECQLHKTLNSIGIDALDKKLTIKKFIQSIQNTKRNIKSFLLDQSNISGLGNIYVDESLFQAKIHPESISNCIPHERLALLLKKIKIILNQSIKYQGTTFKDYRTAKNEKGGFFDQLKVYQKQNSLCPFCKSHKIIKIKLQQRGTHFCAYCQKKYEILIDTNKSH